MRLALTVLLCAACALDASAALADGTSQALNYSWTGLYAGINVGYGYQDSDWDFSPSGSTSHHDNNGVVGLQVGYGAQFGDNLFAGIEASLDASGIDGKSACFGNETCRTSGSSLGDISGLLGITSGQALLYAKGGIAYEDSTHSVEGPNFDSHDNGGAVFGYLVGGGVEYALMYNLTTELEYDYMNFGSNSYTLEPGETRISVREPISLVKLGFNLKFD